MSIRTKYIGTKEFYRTTIGAAVPIALKLDRFMLADR